MNKCWIVSGYYINGFSAGHKELLSWIREKMGEDDELIVIINNQLQQELKYKNKTRHFWEICNMITPFLDSTFEHKYFLQKSLDRDRTVRETLKYIKHWYLAKEFIMVNGGDVTENCPEEEVEGITFIYTGQPKISSSGEEKRDVTEEA